MFNKIKTQIENKGKLLRQTKEKEKINFLKQIIEKYPFEKISLIPVSNY